LVFRWYGCHLNITRADGITLFMSLSIEMLLTFIPKTQTGNEQYVSGTAAVLSTPKADKITSRYAAFH